MMQTKYLIMRPDHPHETREADLAREPLYTTLAALIRPLLDGGDLEHVNVWADFSGGKKYRNLDMFVDDCGLIKHLPRNEAATILYRRANQLGMTAAAKAPDIEQLSHIAGTAILFNRRVWF